MEHMLSIESLSAEEIRRILDLAREMKARRGADPARPLSGQCWAMIFNKASTRTRVSFEVGIRELGGFPLFLSAGEMQLGRGEPIKDTARVLGRMVRGAVIRTYAQADVDDFARYGGIPTINALTDEEHPCQILADLQTIEERLGGFEGRTVTFVGDGACNVARSWLWAAGKLGFELRIAAPPAFRPPTDLVARAGAGHARCLDSATEAAEGADVLYTDVWVSMGKESEQEDRLRALADYQIDADLVARARPGALVMHCLPAYRGMEITEEVLEAQADVIFGQAENRLHAQKAILALLARP